MLTSLKISLLLVLVGACVAIPSARAANCTTQSQMTPADRNALATAARSMLAEIQSGNTQNLKADTLPAVAADFSGIASSVQNLQPLVQKATITVDALYDLDSSTDQPGAASTQFFCGSPVVVLNFSNLPPGKYALAIVHATGVEKPQQLSLILSQTPQQRWLLAGFFAKPMVEAGHDGLWYWTSARKFAQSNGTWAAWFYYRLAANLLDPLDNLSSPNLQKLQHESDGVHPDNLPTEKPAILVANGDTFQITAVNTTTAFGALDLDVHYTPDSAQAAQLRNPPAARKQVTDVMSALLSQHPELHNAFHGMWVHADQGTAALFALELPMGQIATGTQPASNPVTR